MMGDSEGLLTDCAGGLQRLLACGSAIGTTTAPAAAAEDPMFAPANDLLSVGTGNAVANNDNVHSGTGHVEAALLHRFAVALASALNGRYAEAASTIESLTPIATSLCMTAFTTQCAAALLPLVLRLGRSLEQCLAALPLHQLPYRAAVDVLVAFATATATGSAAVPSVAVADVGPGCASALERFAFLARHPQRLAADGPSDVPIAAQIAVAGCRALAADGGCDMEGAVGSLRHQLAALLSIDGAAAAGSARDLRDVFVSRASGSSDPPKALWMLE
jgi:hypothetical protein